MGCGSMLNREPELFWGSWTDCSSEYISPKNSYQTFLSDTNSGFWVTVVDSLEHEPLPGAAIWFGKNPTLFSGQANESGALRIDSSELDTIYVSYIGFDNQYYYRDSSEIDSVIIYLSECEIHMY